MKKIIVLISLFFLCMSASAQADHSSAATVMGATGGAFVGQAVSRNAEGVLVGAAIGGVVGYLIGNEADRERYVVHGYNDGYGREKKLVMRTPAPPPRIVVPYYPRNAVIIPGRDHSGPKRHSCDWRHDKGRHDDRHHYQRH